MKGISPLAVTPVRSNVGVLGNKEKDAHWVWRTVF